MYIIRPILKIRKKNKVQITSYWLASETFSTQKKSDECPPSFDNFIGNLRYTDPLINVTDEQHLWEYFEKLFNLSAVIVVICPHLTVWTTLHDCLQKILNAKYIT